MSEFTKHNKRIHYQHLFLQWILRLFTIHCSVYNSLRETQIILNLEACALGSLYGEDPLEQRLSILQYMDFWHAVQGMYVEIIIYQCLNDYRNRIKQNLKTVRINQTLWFNRTFRSIVYYMLVIKPAVFQVKWERPWLETSFYWQQHLIQGYQDFKSQ